jgi:hypothetical protein
MAIIYNVTKQGDINSTRYTDADSRLVNSFEINSAFNPERHFIEAYYYVEDAVVLADRNYLSYTILEDSEYAGKTGASRVVIDPVEDVKTLEYRYPQVAVTYNFYSNLFSPEGRVRPRFYINQVSEDRLELQLITTEIGTDELLKSIAEIKQRLNSDSTFLDFTLLLDNSVEIIAVAVDSIDYKNTKAVVVKLYQPLPATISNKTELEIVDLISDKATYTVNSTVVETTTTYKKLADPNFNLESLQEFNIPTTYLGYDELLSLDTTYNSNLAELLAKTAENSIDISVDYSSFENFTNYSSAEERLVNFKYKLTLIEAYKADLAQLTSVTGSVTSKKRFEDLIDGIIRNFDHYERYLYFEKSDYSWPKTGTNKPYTLLATNSGTAVTWYNTKVIEAQNYDRSNSNALISTIPQYLLEDPENDPYTLFINMIGHHFDNLWIYTKALTSKYDADNRLNFGASKDLIEEILRNFGVKLYSNIRSTEDLFKYFTLDTYDTQEEVINSNITVQALQVSQKDYQKDLYKRIYHNLPLLLKTKGTERAIRVLITSFGIPRTLLPVKTYGGVDRLQTPYLGQAKIQSGSYDKIRLEGIEADNNTLSYYTSTVKQDRQITTDLHRIEVGYSPTDYINNYLVPQLSPLFNIDNYLGDPRGVDYSGLKSITKSALGSLDRYNLKDFIRLIKFFDNRLFRMITDFTPARAVVDTGIILKQHLLERAQSAQVTVTSTDNALITGSIDTAFSSGSDGSTFGANQNYVTSWSSSIQTPNGTTVRPLLSNGLQLVARSDGEAPRYTGEFSGSIISLTDGELNRANPYKKLQKPAYLYNIEIVSESATCLLAPAQTTTYITTQNPYNITGLPFFVNTTSNTIYKNPSLATISTPTSYRFLATEYTQGQVYTISAERSQTCTAGATVEIAYCELANSPTATTVVDAGGTYDLRQWFITGSVHNSDTLSYIITTANNNTYTVSSNAAQAYEFSTATYTEASSPITLKLKVPALDGKPTECAIQRVLSLTFGCNLIVNTNFTVKAVNEGTTILPQTLTNLFLGQSVGLTEYSYSYSTPAGSIIELPASGSLGIHPVTGSIVVGTANCLHVTASNGSGCEAVRTIAIGRQGNLAILNGLETFGGSFINNSPVVSITITYYNPSGVPSQVNVKNPGKSQSEFYIHPTLTFEAPSPAAGRQFFLTYYTATESLVDTDAAYSTLFNGTPASVLVDVTVHYVTSQC